MGWVYLDDKFTEHPKIVAAGGDAAWLFICGLAYTNRNGMDGVIPKLMVSRLSDRKNVKKLAENLLRVHLWHDMGDHYLIHDYDRWNEQSIQRTLKAKHAAQTRWNNRNGDAQASSEHMPEHDSSTCLAGVRAHAQTMLNICPPQAPSPISIPTPHLSSNGRAVDNFREEEKNA